MEEKLLLRPSWPRCPLSPVAAKLCFHTKEGTQEFVMNDRIAHDLAHMLCTFLLGGECNTEPSAVALVVS